MCEYTTVETRVDAITHCLTLSRKFVECFRQAYLNFSNFIEFRRNCTEMQNLYREVERIKYKENGRGISKVNLVDWFFTGGSTPEYFLKSDREVDIYNDLIFSLLANRETGKIENILYKLLSTE